MADNTPFLKVPPEQDIKAGTGTLPRPGSVSLTEEEPKVTKFIDATPEDPQAEIKYRLTSSIIDTTKDVPDPPAAAFIELDLLKKVILAVLGDFSLLIGKAKSKKTFFLTGWLAALISDNTILKIKGHLPKNKNIVALFDCEQSLYYAHKTARRVLKLSKTDGTTFIAISLRKYEPAERLEIIEYFIYNTPNIGFIAIDGIRDLIRDINSPEEATMIASKLLKWTEELNIHITCVLHMNKGDNNARGHVGTELINKAQTVLSIAKDDQNPEFSIVSNEFARDIEFEPFAFYINDLGLPELVPDYKPKAKQKPTQSAVNPSLMTLDQHHEILHNVFNAENQLSYSSLWRGIKAIYSDSGTRIGDNTAKDFVAYYKKISAIEIIGTHGTINAKYKLSKPV